jgi:hypothetical protein
MKSNYPSNQLFMKMSPDLSANSRPYKAQHYTNDQGASQNANFQMSIQQTDKKEFKK